MPSNTYEDFLDALAQRESSDDYTKVNSLGFLGRYQMGEAALVDAGYVELDGDPSDNDFSGGWTGLNNVFSQVDFLADPLAQEDAIRVYHQKKFDAIIANGLDAYFGQTIGGILITPSGVLAAAHLKLGTTANPGIKQFLESGGTIDGEDEYGTKVSEYLEQFGGPSSPYDAIPIPRNKPPVPDGFAAPLPEERPVCPWEEGALDGFLNSQGAPFVAPLVDPLILDLDGDGVELAAMGNVGSVYWNADLDDFAEAIAWVTGGDGFLAVDLNSDGFITGQNELFGNTTTYAHGFAALAAYDSNSDGYITSADAQFDDLLVWIDVNADGYSQSGELYALDELSITSINLGAVTAGYTISGQEIALESTFTIGGQTRAIVDAWLQYDNINSVYAQEVTLDVRTLFLPTLRGYGNLPDLHIAMSLDETLLEMVEDIAVVSGEDLLDPSFGIEGQLQAILFRWAGVDSVSSTSRGSFIDARQLEFLEELMGQEWYWSTGNSANPGQTSANTLKLVFEDVLASFLTQLLAQTDAKSILGPEWQYDPAMGALGEESAQYVRMLTATNAHTGSSDNDLYYWNTGDGNDVIHEVGGARDILQFGEGIAASSVRLWNPFDNTNDLYIYAGSALIKVDDYFASASAEIEKVAFFDGTSIDLTTNLTLTGTSSAETVSGSSKSETLVGGAGADSLYGYAGNDTYFWSVGDGNDIITEQSGSDKIQFGAGISSSSLRFWTPSPTSGNLEIFIGSEKITLRNQVYDTIYGGNSFDEVELAQFADQSTLSLTNLTYTGTLSDDVIYGVGDNNVLVGLAGNDVIYEYYGGNDSYYGGIGNDTFYDYGGNDTYYWSIGDGNDIISTEGGGTDEIRLGAGILIGDVRFWNPSNGNLELYIGAEKITIRNQLYDLMYNASSFNEVEVLRLSDNSSLSLSSDVDFSGTSSGETVSGLSDANVLKGYGGNDALYGYGDDDVLYGGSGIDSLSGGSGIDTFAWLADDIDGSLDTISDFSKASGDKIDLSDVLSDAGYDPLTDLISDFVRFTEGSGSTTLYVDTSGSGTFSAANDIATLSGVTDILAGGSGTNSTELDLQALISSGVLIAA